MSVALSVLDLAPVRTDQTSADAVAATRRLARTADELGYRRFWVAEHHNAPIASTSPPVMIALLAAATERIRVGSGGVMLPNHTPFVVAEQFALLEAAFPGRIDLGLGRAPGGDPASAYALRQAQAGDAAARFGEDVEQIQALLRPEGAALRLHGREFPLSATPRATSEPEMWLLGSSSFSAELAARTGMPYVYAHHFFGSGTEAALQLYRSQFTPSATLSGPRTFLTLNVSVADTEAEARRLALPHAHAMVDLRTGGRMGPQPVVEAAEARAMSEEHRALAEAATAPWVIGDPATARERIATFAARLGVDEVMVHPVAGAYEGTDPRTAPGREATLRHLAEAFA